MSLRTRLLVPTVLTTLLLAVGIGYLAWVQFSSFERDANRRSVAHAARARNVLSTQVKSTAGLAGLIANNDEVLDGVAIEAQARVLDVITPFHESLGFDLVLVYDLDAAVLARADSPSVFGASDELEGWVLETLEGGPARGSTIASYEGRPYLVSKELLEKYYGPLGVVVTGRDLAGALISDFEALPEVDLAVYFEDVLVASSFTSESWESGGQAPGTFLALGEELAPQLPLSVLLYEDTGESEAGFWRRLLLMAGAATAVCALVILLSHRLVTQTSVSLDDARRAAETAARSKSDFLANMSHEIRTPMTAILGYADLLLDLGQTEEQRLDCVRTIRRNGDHLLSIINDILDISKIEAGKMVMERIECSPCQIVGEVASLMRGRAAEKGLELEIEFEGPIPERIRTDPTRLRQILLNLTGNAIKFTHAGRVTLAIHMRPELQAPNQRIQFDIVDTGIGMSAEQQARIFNPFSQADTSTTRRFGGSGLGLAICKRLARMLGGDIHLKSLPGEGSTFSVTVATGDLSGVPFVEDPTEALRPALPREERQEPSRLEGTLLLAEDGRDNQLLISRVLCQAGLAVDVAENGRVACEMALARWQKEGAYDVILMDMQMPELDGYSATTRLRAAGYPGPIVALTAHAMTGDRERCLEAGCDDYATKPIQRRDLIAKVAKHLAAPLAPNSGASPGPSSPA